jgi:hypothetical protein
MDQLIQAYRSKSLILFVGAGVSMGLGLPSWRQLIDHMAEDIDFDPDIYRTFGNDLTLAEYHRITKGQIGPLRSWMDKEWHAKSTDISKSRIHELIATSDFDLIYTTNYDRWIELAFDNYKKTYNKIVGVNDLATVDRNKTQIVKFHGDFDDDSSIVLDETSYFERLEFESPLDIKLRSDVLGRSVLFIGYSLADINIRYLFFRLANLWRKSSKGSQQPWSYVFSSKPNPVQEAVLEQWNIKMISSPNDDPGKGLVEFMEQLICTT